MTCLLVLRRYFCCCWSWQYVSLLLIMRYITYTHKGLDLPDIWTLQLMLAVLPWFGAPMSWNTTWFSFCAEWAWTWTFDPPIWELRVRGGIAGAWDKGKDSKNNWYAKEKVKRGVGMENGDTVRPPFILENYCANSKVLRGHLSSQLRVPDSSWRESRYHEPSANSVSWLQLGLQSLRSLSAC